MANKKPARKGGAKKCAPKKGAQKRVVVLKSRSQGKSEANVEVIAGPVRDYQVGVDMGKTGDDRTVIAPQHPTVEEQWSDYEGISARLVERTAMLTASVMSGVNLAPIEYGPPSPKPGLLRRAWNGVKRAFRFRSAKTGEFVSQAEAEASPDTTVRERVK